MLGQVLCGWHIYLAILCLLLGLSAGTRTWLGRLALLGMAASAAQVVLLYQPGWAGDRLQAVKMGGSVLVVAVTILGILLAKRQDTRLIALLATGAAVVPLFLFFYHTGPAR